MSLVSPYPIEPLEETRSNADICRLRLLRRITTERALSISIHAICVDAHGTIPDRRTVTLHHEQYFRRHDLVLPPSLSGNYQRYMGLYLRNCIRSYATHPTISEEDRRRVRWGLDRNRVLRFYTYKHPHALQLLYLSRQRKHSGTNPLTTAISQANPPRTSVPTYLPV